MKKILWVILMVLLIVPTIAYAETDVDKVQHMIEEYKESTLRNDEEEEYQKDKITNAIMEIEDDVIRENMMIEMSEVNKSMEDELEVEQTITKINNDDKRNEMISYFIMCLDSVKYLIVGLTVLIITNIFFRIRIK